jgi:plasmid maintenance system antidote protein VapI
MELKPAEVFCPGEFILQEIKDRFAMDIGIDAGEFNAILAGEIPLSETVIRRVAAKLGTTQEFWRRMDAIYQQRKAEDA